MGGFNGAGTYIRFHDWTDDKAAVVAVTASRMDTEMDGVAAVLSLCIVRDGQSTTTARIPFAQGISTAAGGALITGNSTITGTFGVSSIVTVTASATSSSAITGALIVAGGIGAREINAVAISGMGATPVGGVMDYAGATAPTGWLLCFGQAVSRTTYSALFTAISTVHGVGDGSTTFNLPDCRGRVSAGDDDMGGTSANRLTTPINGDTLGAVGGGETVSITVAQENLPNYTLPNTLDVGGSIDSGSFYWSASRTNIAVGGGSVVNDVAHSTNNAQGLVVTDLSVTGSVTSGGSGTALTPSIIQPTIILNKIIFTGVA